jgi:hypothetical protein
METANLGPKVSLAGTPRNAFPVRERDWKPRRSALALVTQMRSGTVQMEQ